MTKRGHGTSKTKESSIRTYCSMGVGWLLQPCGGSIPSRSAFLFLFFCYAVLVLSLLPSLVSFPHLFLWLELSDYSPSYNFLPWNSTSSPTIHPSYPAVLKRDSGIPQLMEVEFAGKSPKKPAPSIPAAGQEVDRTSSLIVLSNSGGIWAKTADGGPDAINHKKASSDHFPMSSLDAYGVYLLPVHSFIH